MVSHLSKRLRVHGEQREVGVCVRMGILRLYPPHHQRVFGDEVHKLAAQIARRVLSVATGSGADQLIAHFLLGEKNFRLVSVVDKGFLKLNFII